MRIGLFLLAVGHLFAIVGIIGNDPRLVLGSIVLAVLSIIAAIVGSNE